MCVFCKFTSLVYNIMLQWVIMLALSLLQAYLAYGVPRSDIKLFSLMQKVCLENFILIYWLFLPSFGVWSNEHTTNFTLSIHLFDEWCCSSVWIIISPLIYFRPHIQLEVTHSALHSSSMWFWRWNLQIIGHKWYVNWHPTDKAACFFFTFCPVNVNWWQLLLSFWVRLCFLPFRR